MEGIVHARVVTLCMYIKCSQL